VSHGCPRRRSAPIRSAAALRAGPAPLARRAVMTPTAESPASRYSLGKLPGTGITETCRQANRPAKPGPACWHAFEEPRNRRSCTNRPSIGSAKGGAIPGACGPSCWCLVVSWQRAGSAWMPARSTRHQGVDKRTRMCGYPTEDLAAGPVLAGASAGQGNGQCKAWSRA
jgi:hypothetical protein